MERQLADLCQAFSRLTVSSATKSTALTFLGLPQELRDIIYSFVLHDTTITNSSGQIMGHHPDSLIRVCKQVRSEVTALYWKVCTFHFEGYNAKWNCLKFISSLPQDCRAKLRDVRITFQRGEDVDPFQELDFWEAPQGFIDKKELEVVQREFEHLQECLTGIGVGLGSGVLKTRIAVWGDGPKVVLWPADVSQGALEYREFW